MVLWTQGQNTQHSVANSQQPTGRMCNIRHEMAIFHLANEFCGRRTPNITIMQNYKFSQF